MTRTGMSKDGKRYAMEEDINRLFEAVLKASERESGQQISRKALMKKAMKKPILANSSPSSSMGVSAHVSLKQALRGICISQASELASMRKLSSPRNPGSSGVLEAKSGGKNYKILQSKEIAECSYSVRDSIEYINDVSLVPEVNVLSSTANKSYRFPVTSVLDPADAYATVSKAKTSEKLQQLGKGKIHAEVSSQKPTMDIGGNRPRRAAEASCTLVADEKVSSNGIVLPGGCIASNKDSGSKVQCDAKSSIQCSKNKLPNKSAQQRKLFLWGKIKPRKNVEQDPCSSSSSCTPKVTNDGNTCSVSDGNNHQNEDSIDIHPSNADHTGKLKFTESSSKVIRDFYQSTKSSIGDISSRMSISEESSFSRSSLSGRRPHMSKDPRWEAIHHIQKVYGNLSLSHFRLLKKLGCGDIGTVYLAELHGTSCLFAIKVMDTEFLNTMNKMPRAQTEREIMQMLDHPFLPTLYAYLTTDKFSCLVMEYCRGGDLHVLRQRQPGRCFSEYAARFYSSEVLLALEYLHLQGVVYRDLKPENILVQDDGHIMLTDFDLSLRCLVQPTLVKTKSGPVSASTKKTMLIKTSSACMDPFGIQLMWQVPCLAPRTSLSSFKTKNLDSDLAAQVDPLPELIVEPNNARSNSFVGTHEYLAPEIIKGEGHGNAVDWWMFGIFLYELLYSRTPFKGETNEETLANVVSQPLTFPQTPIVSFHAKDIIKRLLTKEPDNRLGSLRGAAEIKQHAFFQGINWALVRCIAPPVLPSLVDSDSLI